MPNSPELRSTTPNGTVANRSSGELFVLLEADPDHLGSLINEHPPLPLSGPARRVRGRLVDGSRRMRYFPYRLIS